MPLANLWYTKAATDHLVFHQFQEFFSPGYLKRMRTRARNEFDQEFWWEPGERVPDRAPDLERALGDERCRRKSRPVCATALNLFWRRYGPAHRFTRMIRRHTTTTSLQN